MTWRQRSSARARNDDPRVGTQLAGYRIEASLGQGGMSVVYLAEDLRPAGLGVGLAGLFAGAAVALGIRRRDTPARA